MAQRGFKVINDHQVKLEPREHAVTSPYAFVGNYRDPSQTTPSPQPVSPQMFVQVSPSPSPYSNILQNQLQTPRVNQMTNINNFAQQSTTTNNFAQQSTTTNNFAQQPSLVNQMFLPNIQTTQATFSNGTNSIWTNNLNGNDASTSRLFGNNNNIPASASPIFSQPLAPLPNITQHFNISNEPMANSSILIDLDNQFNIDNLSGDLQSLNFSGY